MRKKRRKKMLWMDYVVSGSEEIGSFIGALLLGAGFFIIILFTFPFYLIGRIKEVMHHD